jgi:hypothetical protein
MRGTAWWALLLLPALAREAGAQHAPQPAPQAPARPRVIFPSPRVAVFTSLAYERKPGAEVCPDEQTFRGELARRLGFDPFSPNPEGISVGDVHVVLAKTRRGFAARSEWTGSRDVLQPVRHSEGPGRTQRDCYDVLGDIAASLAADFSQHRVDLRASSSDSSSTHARSGSERDQRTTE